MLCPQTIFFKMVHIFLKLLMSFKSGHPGSDVAQEGPSEMGRESRTT